mmetsp:Transcript_120313/g.236436  ORF Transcript_120313/g.236436 Transcript_120313/m.236436 type:complete len:149 (+) Transcript_120313:94-540(+)|eukprot:CAMPEP_0170375340 /NCGR_PEP_ID=MMETSP0117_2-20130122/11111_1 /TAXON_ID=400756 /ORGANISM="Durinskia baltica, Strain CSIRO CS-38" /LENGTH=148 /DNA_ID=CAMNT_0010630413 /DNA_START=92 /DNA_END=538 /DNA_ORIENTATION=-
MNFQPQALLDHKYLSPNGVNSLGEVSVLLGLLHGLLGNLLLGESSADSSGLLLSEVNRKELLTGELLSELTLGYLVCDGQNTSNRLSDGANLGKSGRGATGDLGDAQSLELALEVTKLGHKLTLGLVSEFVSLDFLDHCDKITSRLNE